MSQSGRVFQLNISDGGVPKGAIREGHVTKLGIAGDRQNDTEHHGGPERALCLFSLERILELQADGHPIFPGSIGENVTIANLEWSAIVPGARVRLGDEVLIEITDYTHPCRTISGSFVDEDYGRVSQKRHPGWSRVYARVLQPGQIRTGDPVIVEG